MTSAAISANDSGRAGWRCMYATIQVMRGSGRVAAFIARSHIKDAATMLARVSILRVRAGWHGTCERLRKRMERERTIVDAARRCLVCEWEQTVAELESTDVLGPPCRRCGAPTERVTILSRRLERIGRNPHASALGRLGASRGGLARAAALTPKRRREIARIAARARWAGR